MAETRAYSQLMWSEAVLEMIELATYSTMLNGSKEFFNRPVRL